MVRKPLWLSRLWIIPVAMVINSVSLASPFLSVKFVAALRGRPHQKNQTKTGSIIVGNYPDKSWSSNQKKKTYCGWKKSCTTLDGWNPINDGINHLSTGAGFLPSTVSIIFNNDLYWYGRGGSRSPELRILQDKVSEWYFAFSIAHKVTIGFAVIGVINGVFMQALQLGRCWNLGAHSFPDSMSETCDTANT